MGLQTSERVYHLLPLSQLPIVARSAGLHSAPTHVPFFTEPICTEAAALQGEMAPAHCLTLNTAKYMPSDSTHCANIHWPKTVEAG